MNSNETAALIELQTQAAFHSAIARVRLDSAHADHAKSSLSFDRWQGRWLEVSQSQRLSASMYSRVRNAL